MRFENFITSSLGYLHFIASLIALVLGTLVLLLPKATMVHKIMGRFYAIAMSIVLITAFNIYHLYGKWGIFHWTAVISSLTLVTGLLPILLKKPAKHYLSLHYSCMYWSIMGVYGAFVSETLVRIPKIVVTNGIPNYVFYNLTGVGTAFVMGLGVFFFIKLKPTWDIEFGNQIASQQQNAHSN